MAPPWNRTGSFLILLLSRYFILTNHDWNEKPKNSCRTNQLELVHFVKLVSQRSMSLCSGSRGFHPTKVSLSNWSKHGQTCLLIPGHDPPLDITVFMDISTNPGPVLNSSLTAKRTYTQSKIRANDIVNNTRTCDR